MNTVLWIAIAVCIALAAAPITGSDTLEPLLIMVAAALIGRAHRNPSLRLWAGTQLRAA